MKYLIVGTTATNKPYLHSDVIREWSQWINNLNDEWKIVWFVNIDYVEKLEETYETTKENFINLIDKRIELYFMPKKEAHFLTSCKVIALSIKKYIDENLKLDDKPMIFWLEDDWKLNHEYANTFPLENLVKYLHDYHYINLTYIRNNYIWALAPSLISYDLWLDLFYENWMNEKKDIDPEHCIGLYFRKKFGNPNDLINITFINKKVSVGFFDQQYLNQTNSFYTFYNDAFAIDTKINKKYIPLEQLKQNKFVNKSPVMIRVTPNMSIGGCQYGRDFMEKYNLKKLSKTGDTFNYKTMENKEINVNVPEPKSETRLNILCLVNKQTYHGKMSRVRFHGLEKMAEFANIIYWGLDWKKYDNNLSVMDNINNLNMKIDFVECYKPLELKSFHQVTIPKCIRYNEMWDETLTLNEINSANPDLVICHHENDMIRYNKIKKQLSTNVNFVHIPHCAEQSIFYDKQHNKTIDIALYGSIGRHYPFRQRLQRILESFPSKYKCEIYLHPGYGNKSTDTNYWLKEFADHINKTKICLTCTSKYKYRLGKMVEIPMCGSVLACDMPEQDKKEFEDLMIVLNPSDSDQQIINKLVYYLENDDELEKLRLKGLEWSKKYTQKCYANKFIQTIHQTILNKKEHKVYILADEITYLKSKWICDVFKEEFTQSLQSELNSKLQVVQTPNEADIIWLLAPWNKRKINEKILNDKFVITTIHHIDWDKYEEFKSYYAQIDSITNKYHVICPKTEIELKKITNKKIIQSNFWINSTNFYNIKNIQKDVLRAKYNIPINHFVIGSFQKDTEGETDKPKMSKGVDVFIKIVTDMKNNKKKPFVVLSGWRRTYIINNLKQLNIPYVYHEMVSLEELNQLYNCLDLYIVSSRVEGGPRAILECAIAKIPIISTDIGISDLILSSESIFDVNNYMTYLNAKPNVEYAYEKAKFYNMSGYIDKFIKNVF